jgi:hypothetical protein
MSEQLNAQAGAKENQYLQAAVLLEVAKETG